MASQDPVLERLVHLVLWHAHPSVKLTITVEKGRIEIGLDKEPRRKADPRQYLTSSFIGGERPQRGVDELAMEVLLSLAETTVNQATTPKRES